ncbi:hypothetical protein ACVW0P_003992 [Mucilaginibacter sp. UYNi724]
MVPFTIFEIENHLRPDFSTSEFETLNGWDFGWEILSTINIAESSDDDDELSKRFSPGQKALYFFWYLDGAVANGGFKQFYDHNYGKYLPTIKNGLALVGDIELLSLVDKVERAYLENQKTFDEYNASYFQLHDNTMAIIEKYARANVEEFVKLV